MQGLFYRNLDGYEFPLRKVEGLCDGLIEDGIVIAHVRFCLRKEDIERLESELTERLGRTVVVLDGRIDSLMQLEKLPGMSD